MRSSGTNTIYGILMTLLLALLAGVIWLTLDVQPPLPSQIDTIQPQVSAQSAATPTAILAPAQSVNTPIPPTEAPVSSPTATEPPLPTNTDTPEPIATATITPSPPPTPLSLPLPTPPKVARLQTGWEALTLGAPLTALATDGNGFVWLGTKNSITQQSPIDHQIAWNFAASEIGLDSEGIHSILGDKQGGVWVGGKGAAYFNGSLWYTFTISNGLTAGSVQAIAEDNQRRIWLGASEGLSIWNGAEFFILNQQTGLPNDHILALLNDGPRMWIGTNGGGFFRFENNQLQVFNAANVGMTTNVVTALGKLPDGTLLIGSDQGLMTFSGSKAEIVKDVPLNRVTSIVNSVLSEVWVGTEGGGLHHFANGRWSRLMDNANLPDSSIIALTIDSYSSLWIATSDGQLTRYLE